MENYIVIKIENRNIRVPINEVLKEELDNKLIVFEEQKLDRGIEGTKENYDINSLIAKAIYDSIEKYRLTEEQQEKFYTNGHGQDKRQFLVSSSLWRTLEEQGKTPNEIVDMLMEKYYFTVKDAELKDKYKREFEDIKQGYRVQEEKVQKQETAEVGELDLSDKLKNASNNAIENVDLAKEALIRTSENPALSKYITREVVENIMQTIKVCKSDEEYAKEYEKHAINSMKIMGRDITEEDIEYFKELANTTLSAHDYNTNEILLRPETDVDTIVHEVIHGISTGDGVSGITKIGVEMIDNKAVGWENLKKFDITVLDESITEFITKMVLPEREFVSAYTYGVDIVESYHNVCSKKNNKPENIFEAYFNKDKVALKDISNDFNSVDKNAWERIVKSMRSHQLANTDIKYSRFLQTAMTKSELVQVFVDLSNNLEKRREFTPKDIGKATINASIISKIQAQNMEDRNIEDKEISK